MRIRIVVFGLTCAWERGNNGRMMDLENPVWMYLKAAMFLVIGICCFTLVLFGAPPPLAALYMVFMIWAFARLYYFMFYVMEKYVDASYKFSGIFSFLRYMLKKKSEYRK